MGKIGKGYGSEFHLAQWLSSRQQELNRNIAKVISLPSLTIEWSRDAGDKEWKGIDFLPPDADIQKKWKEFWPTGKGIHNWDAVGKVSGPTGPEWILVEAKAHTDEMLTDCKARDANSVKKIKAAFVQVKEALGVGQDQDWMRGCYQFANRLAALWFLHQHNIPAHLLFIYFTGDKRPVSPNPKWNHDSPADEEGWKRALARQEDLAGLGKTHPLSGRIHKLFLPVLSVG